jgi:hypothetical protein
MIGIVMCDFENHAEFGCCGIECLTVKIANYVEHEGHCVALPKRYVLLHFFLTCLKRVQ